MQSQPRARKMSTCGAFKEPGGPNYTQHSNSKINKKLYRIGQSSVTSFGTYSMNETKKEEINPFKTSQMRIAGFKMKNEKRIIEFKCISQLIRN